MEILVNELNRLLNNINQDIDEFLKKDYGMMLNILNKYMNDIYNEDELDKLLQYPFVLENYPNIKQDYNNLKAIRKFNMMLKDDFANFDIDEYAALIEEYPNISFGLQLEHAISLKEFLNTDVTVSKQPIIDNINVFKNKSNRLYNQLNNHFKSSLEQLKAALSMKYNEESISTQLNELNAQKNNIETILSYFNSNNSICPSYEFYKMISNFITLSELTNNQKRELLKEFYSNHVSILVNQARRIQVIVANQVSNNTQDVFDEIRGLETSKDDDLSNKKITLSNLIDQEIIDQLTDEELKLYNEVIEKFTEILDKGNYMSSILVDINLNENAELLKEEDPLRQSYTDNIDIVWEEVIVDLFKHKSDKDEFLKIINGINEAIKLNFEITRLGLKEANRSQRIIEIEQDLNKKNSYLLKLKQSNNRDDLVSSISLLLGEIGVLNENNIFEYVSVLNKYETLCEQYELFINLVIDIDNTKSNNLIIYAPGFIDECRDYPSPSFYHEIKNGLETLENKEQLANVKGNSSKYRIADRTSNGISILKTTHLIIYHTIINENVIYVMGVSRKVLDKKYGPKLNTYLNSIDDMRNSIAQKLMNNREQFIKEINQNQIMVLSELSKWETEKKIGGIN